MEPQPLRYDSVPQITCWRKLLNCLTANIEDVMKRWNNFAPNLAAAVAVLLCSTVLGSAHDLRGLKQQNRHKKATMAAHP